MSKTTSYKKVNNNKRTVIDSKNSDICKIVWVFDNVDNDGEFAFDIHRNDFQHKLILEKMMEYNQMTWAQAKQQTHDNKKSKNHFLDIGSLSKEAKNRLTLKKLSHESESLFSFALQNKIRVIGIRRQEFFHVLWYQGSGMPINEKTYLIN